MGVKSEYSFIIPKLHAFLLHKNTEVRLQSLRLLWILLGGSEFGPTGIIVKSKEELFYRLAFALNDKSPIIRKEVRYKLIARHV
jgi:hypothetical protein